MARRLSRVAIMSFLGGEVVTALPIFYRNELDFIMGERNNIAQN
jgi:hypothetical protein